MSHSKTKHIKVLIVDHGKEPYFKKILSELEALQQLVGALIQAIYICRMPPSSATPKASCFVSLGTVRCSNRYYIA